MADIEDEVLDQLFRQTAKVGAVMTEAGIQLAASQTASAITAASTLRSPKLTIEMNEVERGRVLERDISRRTAYYGVKVKGACRTPDKLARKAVQLALLDSMGRVKPDRSDVYRAMGQLLERRDDIHRALGRPGEAEYVTAVRSVNEALDILRKDAPAIASLIEAGGQLRADQEESRAARVRAELDRGNVVSFTRFARPEL